LSEARCDLLCSLVVCTCCGVSFALETGSPPGGTTQSRRPSGT
jgi:hypothetical protein